MYEVFLSFANEDYELRVQASERAWQQRQLLVDPPGRLDRALAGVGKVLVAAGRRLQRGYALEMGRA